LLDQVPANIRRDLLNAYDDVVTKFSEGNWEPSELNGGKFSEAAYTVLKGIVDGAYPTKVTKPSRFDQACRDFEKSPATFPRSVRIGIPRVLIALYVGHLGGDVDPNTMDASVVLAMVKWVLAELIRILHDVEPKVASEAIESITERTLPLVWSVGSVKRILEPGLQQKDQCLILLHQNNGKSSLGELADSIEVRASNLKRVVQQLHSSRHLEYVEKTGEIHLSPKGTAQAEQLIKNLL
jgi:hypothetical protein